MMNSSQQSSALGRSRQRSFIIHHSSFIICLLCLPAVATASLEPGARAPDFSLPALNRPLSYSLQQVEGPCLLFFLRADQRFTTETLAVCRRLAQRLPAMEGRCRPILIWEGVVSRDLAAATSASLSAQWWIARDDEGSVARSYEVVVSPTIYLIDPQQKITHAFTAWQPLLESQLVQALADDLGIPLPPPVPADPAEARRRSQSNLYFRMGRAVASQGLWEEALTHFERGLAIDPDAPDPLAEAARAAFVVGQHEKARAWATRSLDLQSTHPLARAVLENLEGRPRPLSWEAPTGTTTTPLPVGATPRPTPAR